MSKKIDWTKRWEPFFWRGGGFDRYTIRFVRAVLDRIKIRGTKHWSLSSPSLAWSNLPRKLKNRRLPYMFRNIHECNKISVWSSTTDMLQIIYKYSQNVILTGVLAKVVLTEFPLEFSFFSLFFFFCYRQCHQYLLRTEIYKRLTRRRKIISKRISFSFPRKILFKLLTIIMRLYIAWS